MSTGARVSAFLAYSVIDPVGHDGRPKAPTQRAILVALQTRVFAGARKESSVRRSDPSFSICPSFCLAVDRPKHRLIILEEGAGKLRLPNNGEQCSDSQGRVVGDGNRSCSHSASPLHHDVAAPAANFLESVVPQNSTNVVTRKNPKPAQR